MNILLTWTKTFPIDLYSLSLWEPRYLDQNGEVIKNKWDMVRSRLWLDPVWLMNSNIDSYMNSADKKIDDTVSDFNW